MKIAEIRTYMVANLVAESAKLAIEAQNLKRAHAVLKEIGHILAGLRKEEGITYFMDFVTSVEDALEDAAATVGSLRTQTTLHQRTQGG